MAFMPVPLGPCALSKSLVTVNLLARALMKNAAKCDMCGESQNPANHQTFERNLQPRVFLIAGMYC